MWFQVWWWDPFCDLATYLPSLSAFLRPALAVCGVFLQVPRSEESMQPCFTPLRILKVSDELRLTCVAPFMSERKDAIKLCSFGGT